MWVACSQNANANATDAWSLSFPLHTIRWIVKRCQLMFLRQRDTNQDDTTPVFDKHALPPQNQHYTTFIYIFSLCWRRPMNGDEDIFIRFECSLFHSAIGTQKQHSGDVRIRRIYTASIEYRGEWKITQFCVRFARSQVQRKPKDCFVRFKRLRCVCIRCNRNGDRCCARVDANVPVGKCQVCQFEGQTHKQTDADPGESDVDENAMWWKTMNGVPLMSRTEVDIVSE